MNKTYMSLAVSRAWSTEHPVGDPFGGPAYGERNMPVVAIGAAVWGGMALAAGGLTVFGTIAAIGAVTAGIGVVTGNEKLTKIGGIMGLVGGVGGLASGAGLISDTAGTVTAGGETGAAASSSAQAASGAANPGAVAADAMKNVVPETVASVGGGVGPTVEAAGAAANTGGGLLNAAAPAANPFVGNTLGSGIPASFTGASTPPASGGIMQTLSDYIKPFSKFAKDNPMAAYGIMNVGGNLIGGAFDPLKPAQVDALEAQTDLTKQRTANINAPLPTATSTAPGGVRPNPYAVAVPQPYNQIPINTGLINNAGLKVTGTV